jgi:hypothetical protein
MHMFANKLHEHVLTLQLLWDIFFEDSLRLLPRACRLEPLEQVVLD